MSTGVRWGEVAGLQVRHLHLHDETPHVDIRVACRKGDEGGRTLGRLKSRAAQRTITLSARTVEVVRPLVDGRGPHERVFQMRGGGSLNHGNFRTRYFLPALHAVGQDVPAGFTIHGLRPTHATWLLSHGAPMYRVMRRMGHADTATTERHYGHLMMVPNDPDLHTLDPLSTGRDEEGPAQPPGPGDRSDPYVTEDTVRHLDRAGGARLEEEDEMPVLVDTDIDE